MAVSVKAGSAFEFGTPKPLFEMHNVAGARNAAGLRQQYDISPDGQRILVNVAIAEESSSPITLVLNWTAGLKK